MNKIFIKNNQVILLIQASMEIDELLKIVK